MIAAGHCTRRRVVAGVLGGLLLCNAACREDVPATPAQTTESAAPDDAGPPLPHGYPDIDPLVAARVERYHDRIIDDPDDGFSWVDLGMVYQANWYPELAERCYVRALELNEAQPRGWFYLATVRGEQSRLDEAIEAMTRTIALAPDYAPAVWRMGLLQLDAGDAAAAEQACRDAIALDDRDASAWFGLAQSLLAQGRAEEALAVTQERLLSTDGRDYARRLLGTAYRQLGRIEEAQLELSRGRYATTPWDDPWTRQMLSERTGLQPKRAAGAVLMSQGRHDEAVAMLEPLLLHWPDDVELLNDLAVALARAGDADRAIATLQPILARTPEHHVTLTNLALVHMIDASSDDELRRAMELVDQALEVEPRSATSHRVRGQVLFRMQRFDEAVSAFEAALRHDARMQGLIVEIGRCHVEQEQWADAAAAFERAIERNPAQGQALLWLGVARHEMGDLEGAAAALDAAEPLIEPRAPAYRTLQRRRLLLRQAQVRRQRDAGDAP